MSSMFDVLSQHTPQKHYPNRRVFSSIDELRERLRAAEGKPIREIDGTGRTAKKKNK